MGDVHATAVYDYEKQDRSAHRSIYDNEHFLGPQYLTRAAICDRIVSSSKEVEPVVAL